MKTYLLMVLCLLISGSGLMAEERPGFEAALELANAGRLFEAEKYGEVITVINAAMEKRPAGSTLVQCLLLRGISYLNLYELDLAIKDFNRGIELKDVSGTEITVNFHLAAGGASLMKFDFENGEKHLKTAYENDVNSYRTVCMLGIMEQVRGNYDKSLDYYRKGYRLDGQAYDSLLGIGDVKKTTGKYGAAKAAYKKALKLGESNGSADIGFCEVLCEQGDLNKAIKLLSAFPDYYTDLNKLKSKLILLKALNEKNGLPGNEKLLVEVEGLFRDEIKKNPKNYELYLWQSEMYCDIQLKNGEAIRLAEAAIKLMPNGLAYTVLGRCYLEKGDYEKAGKYLPEFKRVNPNLAVGYLYVGILHKRIKNREKAVEAFKKGLKINPNNRRIKKELREL